MLERERKKFRLRAATAALLAASLVCSWRLITEAPITRIPLLPIVVLVAMALLAEFMPVELPGRGMRLAFTLPFIAALAFVASGSDALLCDIAVTFAAAAWAYKQHPGSSRIWLLLNPSLGAISVFVGTQALRLARQELSHTDWESLAILGFVVAYGVTNLLGVITLEWVSSGRALTERVDSGFRLGAIAVGFYGLVGLVATVLVGDGMAILVPLTLAPVLALRAGIYFRARMMDNYYETITALTLMLQRAHPYTHGHLDRVSKTAERVARRLGLNRSRARLVRAAAVLHDIGKIAVDETILDKPGPLTFDERAHVQKHASWGAQILSPVEEFHEMVPWIRHHHERPDGSGYPDRLCDGEIPIESKIIAVVDAYDAMTGGGKVGGQRSYREPITHAEAMEELARCCETQFDCDVVRVFRDVMVEVGA